MPLSPGVRLGPYEILDAIGAGGMGEVYRARDAKLGRDVALKVLPEEFTQFAARVARLRREAQVLASLNHPHIASIYGFEDSGTVHALVMELVEGPTLAERIKQGAIPLDEALPLAEQICEAVEYAHERGIVHRDLKPSNVKITPEGNVKVLDFGLAKALESDAAATDISSSPTLSAAATRAGFLMGTAAYMSPEQARGKDADRRSDIWAFGVVLFEILSGKRLFDGETTSDTLAEVLKMEPEWGALPANTPAHLRELLARCLKKNARQRLQSIGDARIELDEISSGIREVGSILAGADARGAIRERIAWGAAAVLIIALALAIAGYFARAPQPAPAVVADILPPEGARSVSTGLRAGPAVISPDGKKLAFTAVSSEGKQLLWIRPLSSETAQPLAGTEGAAFPFWSPDNRYLVFFANYKLNRIDASGGPPLAIADEASEFGGAWGPDGSILFNPRVSSGIYRVPSTGGTPLPVTKLSISRAETLHGWPQFLPDGKHFLFYAYSSTSENCGTYAASLDGGEPKLIIHGGSNAIYAAPGYLLSIREHMLMVQRFDTRALLLTGDAIPMAQHVLVNSQASLSMFSVSENDILTYQAGAAGEAAGYSKLLWFDRSGKQIMETGGPASYYETRISPDGKKLATTVFSVPANDIWTFDLARGIKTRLTFTSTFNVQPAWSSDGKTIAFLSVRGGAIHLYEMAADGTGKTTPLIVDDAHEHYPSFSSDGRYLIFERFMTTKGSRVEIWALPLFGDRKAFPVAQNQEFDLLEPVVSPDVKWLAYESSESGQQEVYVVPFLHGSGKVQISNNGGRAPRWRGDGRELFYMSLDQKIMSAEINKGRAGLAVGNVHALFQTNAYTDLPESYDVTADGKKFVVVSQGAQQTSEPVTLVVNWSALLKKQQ